MNKNALFFFEKLQKPPDSFASRPALGASLAPSIWRLRASPPHLRWLEALPQTPATPPL